MRAIIGKGQDVGLLIIKPRTATLLRRPAANQIDYHLSPHPPCATKARRHSHGRRATAVIRLKVRAMHWVYNRLDSKIGYAI
jgi:hypothetical protein